MCVGWDRLMRDEGMYGLVRGRTTRTTIAAKNGVRAKDLLKKIEVIEPPGSGGCGPAIDQGREAVGPDSLGVAAGEPGAQFDGG